MARFEMLKPKSNEAVGVVESLNGDHRAVEDMTDLAIISRGGSCNSDGALADIDLVDVLSGCMESQADADQLAAGLLEMENELKALTDDDSSFLQFPSILQEIFSPESPNGEASSFNDAIAAIPSSISEEYLFPEEQPLSESESIIDHQAMAQHPLLPLISSILQKHTCPTDELLNASECALLDSFKSRSELDTFMRDAVSQAIQLSKDGNDIGNLMQSIDNEGSYFTSEMSTFCRNLLQQDPIPSSDSSEQIQPPHQNPPRDKLAKKKKQKIKPGAGKKSVRLSRRNTQILREWLLEHADNPFPTDSEKDMLCLRTGITLSKLTTWFVNSRRRILAPLGLKSYQKK